MNIIIQNILIFAALAYAIWFLLRKFGIIPKRKSASSKACGGDDGCGCH